MDTFLNSFVVFNGNPLTNPSEDSPFMGHSPQEISTVNSAPILWGHIETEPDVIFFY